MKSKIKYQMKQMEINERGQERRDHSESPPICMTLVHLLTCVNIGWLPARTARVARAPYIALRPSAFSLQ